MKRIPLTRSRRNPIGSVLVAIGLIAATVGVLVALPEHGAGLRCWIGAVNLARDEPVGSPRWWIKPIETYTFLRRFVTTASLNDIAVMDDDRTIFIVGSNGTLLKTGNAGATWRSLADNVEWRDATSPDNVDGPALETSTSLPDLNSVISSPDGSVAIAVGNTGIVLTRSGAGRACGSRRVVRGPLRRLTPASPASRITRATRLRLTCVPSAASSA